jgi:hypothetical protein
MSRDQAFTTQPNEFQGFASPSSNTVYAPNQFFDVVLRNASRGCVRIVSHLIRQTLGWSDRDGNPLRERHAVSYAEFERAGVGKDTVRAAIDEALRAKYIRCLREPVAGSARSAGVAGLYELRWDDRDEYIKEASRFEGFFAGEGHRTHIPNQYFDVVVPNEPLAVIKAVGAVIRFSIGFQTKWGHRRQEIALSYRDIQRYTHMSSPRALSGALQTSLAKNYLTRVSEGYFDPNGGTLSAKACYALKWLNPAAGESGTRKRIAESATPRPHSETDSGGTRKGIAARHSETDSDIETTERKNTNKEQTAGPAAVTLKRLRAAGFDARAAQAIASRHPAERIDRQLEWIDRRKATANRLGMLRRAIEQDWGPPDTAASRNFGRPKFSSEDVPGREQSVADVLHAARRRFLGETTIN